jgi:hypothetical protein
VDAGVFGGIVGAAIGIFGGIVGTYFSIKSTLGPRERRFMVRVAIVAWVAIGAFVLGLLLLPQPINFFLWVPYAVALPLGILWCNRRQRIIREEEASREMREHSGN